MTTLALRLRQWALPLMIVGAIFASLTTSLFIAPTLVEDVSAQTLTADDLIDETFQANTGLGDADLKGTIGNLIRVVLGFLGVIAVVIILYGGFIWMTAGGSEDKVKKAQKIIVAGAIGLAIILSAFAITQFIIGEFITATSTSVTE